jgi:hypothetical protein
MTDKREEKKKVNVEDDFGLSTPDENSGHARRPS